jgi:hypothetical protein
MHSSSIGPYSIAHNGDFSGDAILHGPSVHEETGRVKLPVSVMFEVVGRALHSARYSRLEDQLTRDDEELNRQIHEEISAHEGLSGYEYLMSLVGEQISEADKRCFGYEINGRDQRWIDDQEQQRQLGDEVKMIGVTYAIDGKLSDEDRETLRRLADS